MVIHCPNVIPEDEQDKLLLEKMCAESSGIVYKAVMALKRVIANGYRFSEPESVIAAREAYRQDNNTVLTFFRECMERRQSDSITDGCTTGKVFDVYKAWCVDNNNGYAKTVREFREAIAGYLGCDYADLVVHSRKGRFFKDYTLTAEAKEQYRTAYGYDTDGFLS